MFILSLAMYPLPHFSLSPFTVSTAVSVPDIVFRGRACRHNKKIYREEVLNMSTRQIKCDGDRHSGIKHDSNRTPRDIEE